MFREERTGSDTESFHQPWYVNCCRAWIYVGEDQNSVKSKPAHPFFLFFGVRAENLLAGKFDRVWESPHPDTTFDGGVLWENKRSASRLRCL